MLCNRMQWFQSFLLQYVLGTIPTQEEDYWPTTEFVLLVLSAPWYSWNGGSLIKERKLSERRSWPRNCLYLVKSIFYHEGLYYFESWNYCSIQFCLLLCDNILPRVDQIQSVFDWNMSLSAVRDWPSLKIKN